ncbi:hypothetical protein ANSO36C_13570 [Nostoc cf. commune SO-36]|uniref:histidine kinase n=1 Tax=Nostoc cf. commune SO-36 TaxID=449208 RepID=A0ABM7YY09_NOSCO|nr:hypothetical protein ANSO36C_13570 [Nostoc cf. commune SO-36]
MLSHELRSPLNLILGWAKLLQTREFDAPAVKKAIALTAYAGEINQQQALESGFQKHLSKPVEPEELVKAIATLIGRSGNS